MISMSLGSNCPSKLFMKTATLPPFTSYFVIFSSAGSCWFLGLSNSGSSRTFIVSAFTASACSRFSVYSGTCSYSHSCITSLNPNRGSFVASASEALACPPVIGEPNEKGLIFREWLDSFTSSESAPVFCLFTPFEEQVSS
jgi:hypothetical protein